jgi:deoxyribose-phosphate aldolase
MLDHALLGLIADARSVALTPLLARRLISLLELSALGADQTSDVTQSLCRNATTPAGAVAAVCVFPGYVRDAKTALGETGVKIATVVDFPEGIASPEEVMRQTAEAVGEGAEEIGLVFPYLRFLADVPPPASKNIRGVHDAGGYDVRLKVLFDAGVFPAVELFTQATEIAVQSGADFLEIVPGANGAGSTLESAALVLSVIAESGLPIGFKATIETANPAEAAGYLILADAMLGEGWAKPENFRLGAGADLLSKLLAI